MPDRRDTDKIILDRLEKIDASTTQIKIDLALNTKETARIADAQVKTNGKVAAHQASIIDMQAKETVMANTIASLQAIHAKDDAEKEQSVKNKESRRLDNISRAWWLVIGIALSLIGNIINYLIRTDAIKEIIK